MNFSHDLVEELDIAETSDRRDILAI